MKRKETKKTEQNKSNLIRIIGIMKRDFIILIIIIIIMEMKCINDDEATLLFKLNKSNQKVLRRV